MSVQTGVCIDYDTYNSLGSFISDQFLKPDTTDVRIAVTSIEAPNRPLKTFSLHRFILHQATFFRPLFNGNRWVLIDELELNEEPQADKGPQVYKFAVVDEGFVSLEVVELLFKLFYVDNLSSLEKEICDLSLPLFHVANQVGFDRLKNYCDSLISSRIDSSNVLTVLDYCLVNGDMKKTLIYIAVIQWLKLFFFPAGMYCEENIRLFDASTAKILCESPEFNCYVNGKQLLADTFELDPQTLTRPSKCGYIGCKGLFFRDEDWTLKPNRRGLSQDPMSVKKLQLLEMEGCKWTIFAMYNLRTSQFYLSVYPTSKSPSRRFLVKTVFYFVHREGTEKLQNKAIIEVNKSRMDLSPINLECLNKAFLNPQGLLVNGIVLQIKIKRK